MAIPVEMPKMSDTMEEGVVVSWLVEEGSSVAAGDVIAQVETDKATMDLEVYDDGTLLKIVAGEGDAVPIGGLIAVLGKEGEDVSDVLSQYSGDGVPAGKDVAAEESSTAQPAQAEAEGRPVETAPAPSGDGAPAAAVVGPDGRIKASPLARKMASEGSIDLSAVRGSGPGGRIIKRDIEAAMADTAAAPSRATEVARTGPEYEVVRISQMRKTIARRLSESKFGSPHFYLNVDIDMAGAVEVRSRLNAVAESQGRSKISFNDMIVKACAMALRQHPAVNSSWVESEGEIRRHRDIHVAVAVAIDEGLVTPVIRNADLKGLTEIAAESKDLAARARDRTLDLAEMEGSTFTTSNLGMLGIDHFTAIINPPNACILAIGGIRDVPVVKGGAVVPGKRMTVTLSCDHRIVDGAMGARYLSTVKQYLEEPAAMLL